MSLHQIKVARKEVLAIVRENKEKHDVILKDAIEGYWLEAEGFLKKYEKEQCSQLEKAHKDSLKVMRKNLRTNKKNIKEQVKKELDLVKQRKKDGPFVYMRNRYPEDHTDDYIGTIRRLELCVEDQLELDNNEFDCYIRNKWQWRQSFITANTGYVSSLYTNNLGISCSYALTSSWGVYGDNALKGSPGLTGSLAGLYAYNAGTGSVSLLSNF